MSTKLTPFERFEKLARAVVRVPKKAVAVSKSQRPHKRAKRSAKRPKA